MRKYLSIMAVFLMAVAVIFPQTVEASISIDSSADSSAQDNTAVTSVTYALTITSGDFLVVCTIADDSTDADRPVTDVTWNSVSLTKLREDDDATANVTTGIWYTASPATGTHNIVVSYTGTVSQVASSALSLSGVTGIDNSSTTTTINSTTFSSNITALSADAYITDCTYALSALTTDPVTSQTEIMNFEPGAFEFALSSYDGPVTGASTIDYAPGNTGSDWYSTAVSLSATAAEAEPSWKKEYPQEIQWY